MEWISVEERLPLGPDELKEIVREFWIYDPQHGVRRTLQHSAWWNSGDTEDQTVTHWMELIRPEAPK